MSPFITNRPMSGFPVSIGTGLALETLFDPTQAVFDEARQVDKLDDISNYTLFIFNVSTLLRNLLSCFKYSQLITLPKKELCDALGEEVEFIRNHLDSLGLGVRFYIHNYSYVKSTYPTRMRKPSTEQQLSIASINDYCLSAMKKDDDIHIFSKDIHYGKTEVALINTHVPFDLLSYDQFAQLDLLESHTGKIKKRQHWNSKYLPVQGCDMSVLPFMEYLLSVFGDSIMFKPESNEKRLSVYNSMVKKGVNPLTSELSISFMR